MIIKISIIIITYLSLNIFTQGEINQNNTVGSNDNLQSIIIDSDLNFSEAVSGIKIPASVIDNLVLINVRYYSFDSLLHQGQLLIHKDVARDIKDIFKFIEDSRFPIEKVIPISEYNWSDEASADDNNTSAFNYRFVSGTRILSNHAHGFAIDINPKQNPYIKRNIKLPAGSSYKSDVPGTINSDSKLVKEFKKRGWSWGGNWRSVKDYQHFEKRIFNKR